MYSIISESNTNIVRFNGYHIATIHTHENRKGSSVTLHFKNNETERFGTFTEAMEFMDMHFRALMKIIEGVLTNRFIQVYTQSPTTAISQSNSFDPDTDYKEGMTVIDVYSSKAYRKGKWEDIV